MKKAKTIQTNNHRLRFLIVTLCVAVVGTAAIAFTRAAVSTASFEAEAGTLNSAQTVTDALASGGQAIQFGAAVASPMNIYFGSTHNHTGTTNDHGQDTSDVNEVLSTAKAKDFDWMLVTEHSGASGPTSQGISATTFYNDVKARVAQYTDATFVAIEGAEFSDNDTCNGIKEDHMTAAATDTFPNPDGCASNGATLMDSIYQQTQAGRKAFAGFNHPGAGGHAAATADKLTANRRQVTVMSEVMNGVFDVEGSDNGNYQGFIKHLDTGWRVAPVCGLDGHGLFRINSPAEAPGKYFCRTGALMPSLSRANLIDSFLARSLYASRDANLQVKYKVNTQWMGSIIGTPATLNFDITISDPDTGVATDKIKKIEIMTSGGTSGTVVQSQTFDSHSVSWQPSVPANGKKYFFIRVYNGEHTSFTAVAAPVWLE